MSDGHLREEKESDLSRAMIELNGAYLAMKEKNPTPAERLSATENFRRCAVRVSTLASDAQAEIEENQMEIDLRDRRFFREHLRPIPEWDASVGNPAKLNSGFFWITSHLELYKNILQEGKVGLILDVAARDFMLQLSEHRRPMVRFFAFFFSCHQKLAHLSATFHRFEKKQKMLAIVEMYKLCECLLHCLGGDGESRLEIAKKGILRVCLPAHQFEGMPAATKGRLDGLKRCDGPISMGNFECDGELVQTGQTYSNRTSQTFRLQIGYGVGEMNLF